MPTEPQSHTKSYITNGVRTWVAANVDTLWRPSSWVNKHFQSPLWMETIIFFLKKMIWLSTFSNGFRQVKIKQTFCKIFFWPMSLLELGWDGGKNLLLANQRSLLQERNRPFKTGKWSLMIFKQTLIKLSTKIWKDLGSYKDLCPICDFSSCLWYREVANYHIVEYINLFVYLCFLHIAKKKKKKKEKKKLFPSRRL